MIYTTAEIIMGSFMVFLISYFMLKVTKYKETDNNINLIKESEEWLKNKK